MFYSVNFKGQPSVKIIFLDRTNIVIKGISFKKIALMPHSNDLYCFRGTVTFTVIIPGAKNRF
jgi:hypothetical protein